jgi:hypothetical protein
VRRTRRPGAWILALVLLAGCPPPRVAPPPPIGAQTIVIPSPTNRTGNDLLVSGDTMLESWVLRSDRVTVPDVLASDAEALLRARGYHATAEGARPPAPDAPRDGLRLTIEIRRWEPDSWTHPQFVIVGVAATLTDGATGRAVWSSAPPIRHVATPGTAVLGSAYEIAARKAIDDLLGSWPARTPG